MIKKSLERDTVGWMEEKGGADLDLGHVLLSSFDLLYIYHVLVTWGALSNQRSYHALLRSRGVSALAEKMALWNCAHLTVSEPSADYVACQHNSSKHAWATISVLSRFLPCAAFLRHWGGDCTSSDSLSESTTGKPL